MAASLDRFREEEEEEQLIKLTKRWSKE